MDKSSKIENCTPFDNGCSDPRLFTYIRKIHELAFDHNIALAMDWVSTNDQEADAASRLVDIKEAIFIKEEFKKVEKKLGLKFTLDAMATPHNKK